MTELEKEVFQCQKQDLLSYIALPLIKVSPDLIGEGYFRTYLTFSGKIVITASTVRDHFKFYLHEDYLLSFKEQDKIHIVFNHPKQYEEAIISILNGQYSKIPQNAIGAIKIYSGMKFNFPVYGGRKYTHPVLSGILKEKSINEKLEQVGLSYGEECLPPLHLYEDLIDLDTVII